MITDHERDRAGSRRLPPKEQVLRKGCQPPGTAAAWLTRNVETRSTFTRSAAMFGVPTVARTGGGPPPHWRVRVFASRRPDAGEPDRNRTAGDRRDNVVPERRPRRFSDGPRPLRGPVPNAALRPPKSDRACRTHREGRGSGGDGRRRGVGETRAPSLLGVAGSCGTHDQQVAQTRVTAAWPISSRGSRVARERWRQPCRPYSRTFPAPEPSHPRTRPRFVSRLSAPPSSKVNYSFRVTEKFPAVPYGPRLDRGARRPRAQP